MICPERRAALRCDAGHADFRKHARCFAEAQPAAQWAGAHARREEAASRPPDRTQTAKYEIAAAGIRACLKLATVFDLSGTRCHTMAQGGSSLCTIALVLAQLSTCAAFTRPRKGCLLLADYRCELPSVLTGCSVDNRQTGRWLHHLSYSCSVFSVLRHRSDMNTGTQPTQCTRCDHWHGVGDALCRRHGVYGANR